MGASHSWQVGVADTETAQLPPRPRWLLSRGERGTTGGRAPGAPVLFSAYEVPVQEHLQAHRRRRSPVLTNRTPPPGTAAALSLRPLGPHWHRHAWAALVLSQQPRH